MMEPTDLKKVDEGQKSKCCVRPSYSLGDPNLCLNCGRHRLQTKTFVGDGPTHYEQYRDHKRDKPTGFQKIKRKPKRGPKR